MRSFIIICVVALLAGMAFAVRTLVTTSPPATAATHSAATARPLASPTSGEAAVASIVPVSSAAVAMAITTTDETEATGLPTLGGANPTDTVEPPTQTPAPSASATPAPPTSTPLPPTATATATIVAPIQTGHQSAPLVNAKSIAVVDETSGALLYGKDPHRGLPPASITKIVTALVALQKGNLSERITANFDQSGLQDSTLMGIRPGEQYTLEDLLYGLMLPSGNDAALAIANRFGGSVAGFADLMNAESTMLGLHDSHFVNPHGLDTPGHVASAYDMAMFARYGMTHFDEFQKLARANTWDVHGTRSFTVYNLNRFLRSYSGADGVKIGYDDLAGRTIVASATRNGHRVYVVLMNCGDIVNDTTPLFNWAFANFTWKS